MDKVEKVFTLIYNDSKLKEELIKKQTIDEMYEYCTSISSGYTKEEFNNFVNKMCQYVKDELIANNLSISDDDIKKVSGGAQLKNKAISSLLAAMTISTPLVGAASNDQKNTGVPVENKVSITQKIKNFVSKNPIKAGTTAVGISTMVILGVTLHKKNKQEKKATEEKRKAEERRKAEEERSAQEEADRQNRLELYKSIDSAISNLENEITAQQELLAPALIKLQNPEEVTDENISAAKKALDIFSTFITTSNTRMNDIRKFIGKMSSGKDKDTLQNKYDALHKRILNVWLEFDQMKKVVNEKNTEKIKNFKNILGRPKI